MEQSTQDKDQYEWGRGTIRIALPGAKFQEVECATYGHIAVFQDELGWNVTHIPTGRSVMSTRHRGVASKEQCAELAHRLVRIIPDSKSPMDVGRHYDAVMAVLDEVLISEDEPSESPDNVESESEVGQEGAIEGPDQDPDRIAILKEQNATYLSECPAHGRTVNALAEAGIETEEQAWEAIKGCSHIDHAISALKKIEGVGEKGSRQVVEWVIERRDFVFPDDVEVGQEGSQEEQEEQEGGQDVPGPEERSAYPAWVYDLPPSFIADAKQAVDERREGFKAMPIFIHEGMEQSYIEWEREEFGEDEEEPKGLGYEDTLDFPEDEGSEEEPEAPEEGKQGPATPPRVETVIVPINERAHPMIPCARLLGRADHQTGDWYELRAAGVGSSDAGAILGVSPYGGPTEVWQDKVGEGRKRQPWLEDYADFGSWFEPYLRRHLEMELGVQLLDGAEIGTLQSAAWPHALANIDALDIVTGHIEEYKTTTEKWSEIPLPYLAQTQHQMMVAGAEMCRLRQFVCPVDRALIPSLRDSMRELVFLPEEADEVLAEWLLEKGEVHTWIVDRDEAYIARLMDAEKRFWSHVEAGTLPPYQDPDGTADLSDEAEVVAAMEEWSVAVAPVEAVKPARKKADQAKKAARRAIEKVVSLLEEKPKRLVIGDHKATLVQRDTHSYWQLYKGDGDDLF